MKLNRTLSALFLLFTSAAPPALGQDSAALDGWLESQASIETWRADVVQTRHLRSLARPLESKGEVWFVQPNLFRWQLGEPPRTIAVRSEEELTIAYPRLARAEVYPFGENLDAAWQQAMALLEVGFPSDAAAFKARYELLSSERIDGADHFRLRPKSAAARRLIGEVLLVVSAEDSLLLATELTFPDGSRMRNDFSAHQIDPEIDPALFALRLEEGYEVVRPLEGG